MSWCTILSGVGLQVLSFIDSIHRFQWYCFFLIYPYRESVCLKLLLQFISNLLHNPMQCWVAWHFLWGPLQGFQSYARFSKSFISSVLKSSKYPFDGLLFSCNKAVIGRILIKISGSSSSMQKIMRWFLTSQFILTIHFCYLDITHNVKHLFISANIYFSQLILFKTMKWCFKSLFL